MSRCASSRAWLCALVSVNRMSAETYHAEVATTTTSTSSEISAVSLALRLRLIFLQFVVKGLKADAQHLRGSCLVVVGKGQGFDNQAAFRLLHREPGPQPQDVISHRGLTAK